MNRGTISNVRQQPSVSDQIDKDFPMPCVGTGEAVAPAAYTTTSAYVEVPDSRIDTQQTGHKFVGYNVAVATQSVKAKLCGSMNATTWEDIIADDATGVAQAGAELTIAAAAHNVMLVTDKDARCCFRYYAIFAKDAVGGTHGIATVTGISK